ncbi:MAG: phosphoribosylformylglycinamidine synthase subunit PurQ, partial [Polyangiaceae bacterium]
MHATVVLFPGINADAEMVRTLRDVCGLTTVVVRHTATELPRTDLVAIPGGFSYGDYLRCGAIAKVAPIVHAITAHAKKGGYVLGVCNGFQILTEAGLLPGALTRNENLLFRCHDVFVKVTAVGPFSPTIGDVWRLPIAHGEGRYQASAEVLAELEGEGRVALRYASAKGDVVPEANPNGSADNIAGIYGGPKKNVLGLMPHPERMSNALQGGDDGRRLFDALVAFTQVV